MITSLINYPYNVCVTLASIELITTGCSKSPNWSCKLLKLLVGVEVCNIRLVGVKFILRHSIPAAAGLGWDGKVGHTNTLTDE